MPGILPMKVIKVGTSAQSRIAQACDRCRSKKIRCDGVTPCCSQCSNVEFVCKTSDKLSRRAFPRGYTESLEERVRALEGEVRELKDLLDEKEEKIDMLSRIHSFASPRRSSTTSTSPALKEESSPPNISDKEDTFKIQQSSELIEDDNEPETYFVGASAGRVFVDIFKSRVQESGKPTINFDTKALFTSTSRPLLSSPSSTRSTTLATTVPPRLLSDQLMNVFFQEWAPLFPILHRPTFLQLYANYVADPTSIKDPQSIAQLHLVFGIAALSIELNAPAVNKFELQWLPALNSIISKTTLATLQCLVLAQICCLSEGDHSRLLYYKGIAVTMSQRLGLHRSQKRFSIGALARETRKKVLWSLYTLDCFSAAVIGLPKILRDDDIQTEFPADVDDENVTERGFQPALPGESTRLSSALALFRLARILSKVIQEVSSGDTFAETTLQKIGVLSDELDEWNKGLAPHLRLNFVQDKPSTNVISSRSPLLSLAYYYVRTLIHRPVVTSALGSKASSSVIALADSSKHIIQIVQLLEERKMNFSFCLNKNELLVLAGFGLLYQNLDLKEEGSLIRDNQRLVCSVIHILERDDAPATTPFKQIACSIIAVARFAPGATTKNQRKPSDDTSMPAPQTTARSSTRKQLQAFASRFAFGSSKQTHIPNSRRSTTIIPSRKELGLHACHSSLNLPSTQTGPVLKRANSDIRHTKPAAMAVVPEIPNLDYLAFDTESQPAAANSEMCSGITAVSDWDQRSGNIDIVGYTDSPQQSNTFGAKLQPVNSHDSASSVFTSFDRPSPHIEVTPPPPAGSLNDWAPEVWGFADDFSQYPAPARSVFSFSEESTTSGEELSSCDFGSGSRSGSGTEFRGITMPNLTDDYGPGSGFEL
ncbi:hypothetical protein MMC13_001209 [Lambiella insularis]|nr:hypothetical protein [Lambiella insularis]